MPRHQPRTHRDPATAAPIGRGAALGGLLLLTLLACSGPEIIPLTPAPPAEQTRLASVARLFGEGRPLDDPTYWPGSTGTGAADSVAYMAKQSGRYHIFVCHSSGRGRHALTSAPGSNSHPSWDPTGTWLAYATIRTGHWDIWRVARDGSFDLPVTGDDYEDRDPAVSPAGEAMVFASRRDATQEPPTFDLWWMDFASGVPEQLTRSDGDDRHPSWSPDGRSIVYHHLQADSTAYLVVLDVDSGRGRRLTDPGGALDTDPEWSPDGRFIAFASTRGGSWDLWIIDAEETEAYPRPLTDSPHNDREPSWSPHDRTADAHLLFISDRDGDQAVWGAWELLR